MDGNIMIPLSLFTQIVDLLEQIDCTSFDYSLRNEYGLVLWALNIKKQKLVLRDAYAKIIREDHPDETFEARLEYLREKRRLARIVKHDVIF